MQNRAVLIGVVAIALVGAGVAFMGGGFFSFHGASVAPDSRSLECGRDLQGALQAFKQKMDMPFEVGPEDYRAIFETGEIEKEYYRDGVKIGASFQLEKSDSGCSLTFYKRSRSEPGSYKSTSGNYGSVALSVCKCAD